MTDPVTIREAKQALRQRMGQLRHISPDSAGLIASIVSEVVFQAGDVVAGIWPLPGEPDLRPLWHRLHALGHRVLLPETPLRGHALRFRPWRPGCTMVAGRFGTWHPDQDPPKPAATPDLLFVPLLAFDDAGYRLGYGGGYYDRTLAALPRARAIGYGFSFQRVEAVPRGPFDIPLRIIVTEAGRVGIER